jgi:phosphatidylglycerol:prolipoprotein diacylglycerol transferase
MTNLHVYHTVLDFFSIWSGGLSILGAIISTLITLPAYLYYKKLPVFNILDRLALYTPLLQSISRLGCFFAGCCYGQQTCLPWAVMYTHPDALAPLHVWIHPTQLYSSICLGLIFLFLYSFDQYCPAKKSGQIVALYVFFAGLERFFIDFFRADQDFYIQLPFNIHLSIQQILALTLCIIALLATMYLTLHSKKNDVSNFAPKTK